MADNARIMPLKFLKPGGGYTSDAIVAIQYATAEGASVINASWGGSGYSQALCDAIAQAGDAGVLFVAAAGNAATDNDVTAMWPANCPAASLVSVASTTSADGLSSFSNRGAVQVDLGAPGERHPQHDPGWWLRLQVGHLDGGAAGRGHRRGARRPAIPGIAPWQVKAAIGGGGDPLPSLAGLTSTGRRADLTGAIALAGAGVGPDTTPPDPFGALSPAEGLATSSATPVFRWSPSSDAQSGVIAYRLTLDGAVVAQVGPGVTQASAGSALAEGVHRWSVTAVDGIGNVRDTAVRTLLVDRTAPTAPAPSTPADGAQVAGPEVTLGWSPSADPVSGVAAYRVLVDGAGVASAGPGARSVVVRLAPGRHTWQVLAVDAAGNQASSAVSSFAIAGAAGGEQGPGPAPAPQRARPDRLRQPPAAAPPADPRRPCHLHGAARRRRSPARRLHPPRAGGRHRRRPARGHRPPASLGGDLRGAGAGPRRLEGQRPADRGVAPRSHPTRQPRSSRSPCTTA